jgi:hypothetical protein
MKTKNNIFGLVFGFAALMGCAVSNNAMAQEEVTPPASNVEFSSTFQGAKTNYATVLERKEPWRDKVETYVGNETEPTVLWSRRIWAAYIGIGGGYRHFDESGTVSISAEVGYMWKWVGGSLRYTGGDSKPDRTSMDQRRFHQDDLVGTLYFPLLHLAGHHVIAGPMFSYGKKFCKDLQEATGTTVEVYRNEEDNATIKETTSTFQDLDNRASTKHWYVGAFVAAKPWGSRFGIKAEIGWGKGQQLTFIRPMWHEQIVANLSVTYTFFDGGSFNDRALKALGLSKKQVKKNTWF